MNFYETKNKYRPLKLLLFLLLIVFLGSRIVGLFSADSSEYLSEPEIEGMEIAEEQDIKDYTSDLKEDILKNYEEIIDDQSENEVQNLIPVSSIGGYIRYNGEHSDHLNQELDASYSDNNFLKEQFIYSDRTDFSRFSENRYEQSPEKDDEKSLQNEKEDELEPGISVYEVQPGDTISGIANKFDVDLDTIVGSNQDLGDLDHIEAGAELRIMNEKGIIHKVQSGQTLWDIAVLYDVEMEEILDTNRIKNPEYVLVGQELIIPGAVPVNSSQLAAGRQVQRSLIWPLRGYITSPFGPRWGRKHEGIDIAVPTGTSVKAAANGEVTYAGWKGGYGYTVTIEHAHNMKTLYAHNSRLTVDAGDYVSQGDQIALSGNTGNSTGPHLHFEVHIDGEPEDPKDYLP